MKLYKYSDAIANIAGALAVAAGRLSLKDVFSQEMTKPDPPAAATRFALNFRNTLHIISFRDVSADNYSFPRSVVQTELVFQLTTKRSNGSNVPSGT